jgi:hypothetical protein
LERFLLAAFDGSCDDVPLRFPAIGAVLCADLLSNSCFTTGGIKGVTAVGTLSNGVIDDVIVYTTTINSNWVVQWNDTSHVLSEETLL